MLTSPDSRGSCMNSYVVLGLAAVRPQLAQVLPGGHRFRRAERADLAAGERGSRLALQEAVDEPLRPAGEDPAPAGSRWLPAAIAQSRTGRSQCLRVGPRWEVPQRVGMRGQHEARLRHGMYQVRWSPPWPAPVLVGQPARPARRAAREVFQVLVGQRREVACEPPSSRLGAAACGLELRTWLRRPSSMVT